MEGINIALLPPVEVVTQVDFEEIVSEIVQEAGIENASPTDPSYRIALACAYRESILRQDANEQARGVMLAFAKGAALDHVGVTYYKHPDGSPVTRLDGEPDEDYRARLQASPEGLSVAGPDEGYRFHARSAHHLVKDVSVDSPAPVEVDLYILSNELGGAASDEILTAVSAYIEPRRPLTDLVRVNSAEIIPYNVTASLVLKAGPDPELVRQTAENSVAAYIELKRALGGRVVESGLHASLMIEGVEEVHLSNWTDVICNKKQAPVCESMSVTIESYV